MTVQKGQSSAVLKLQADALDPAVSVASLLRTAKVIATKLGQDDALVWIDAELGGYMQTSGDDLPAYRRLRGSLMAWNPYQGWQAVLFPENSEIHPVCYAAPIGTSIGEIESDKPRKKGQGAFHLDPARKARIVATLSGPKTDVALFLSPSSMDGILEAVRNLVLDWALKLEKAGVLGEGMVFSDTDKAKAGPVTQQFIIQNAGVVGNVSDSATVTNNQTATMSVDAKAALDFSQQVKGLVQQLPADVRSSIEQAADQLESEAKADKPNQSKLRDLLSSVRTIAEGAAGNLAAMGIVTAATALLG